MSRFGVSSILVVALGVGIVSCRTTSPGSRNPGSASVIAAIDGMDSEDRSLPGLTYKLFCDSGVTAEGTIFGSGADEVIRFPGDRVADGDECALEVRAVIPEADLASFTWHAKPEEQAIGLVYGSDKAKVEARKLALTLYKLFSRIDGAQFTTVIDVAFDVSEAGSRLPDFTKVSAAMECDTEKLATGIWRKAERDSEGGFTFTLGVSALKGKKCQKLTVLETQVALFEGDLDPAVVAFPDPKRGDAVKFDKRFTLKPRPVSGDAIVTTVAGDCINFDAARRRCMDRRSIEFPRESNYWVARIEVRDAAKKRLALFVAPGAKGFALDASGRTKTAQAMTAALRKDASPAERAAFNFYPAGIASDLFTYTFDKNFVDGLYHTSFVLARETIEDSTVLNIDKVWFHGFAPVAESDLDKLTSARWLALVEAKKDAQTASFVVAGPRDYFYSDRRRAGSTAAPKFFSWEAFRADRDAASGHFRVYALRGGPMATSGCENVITNYVDDVSSRHLGELDIGTASTGRIARMDACQVAAAAVSKDFDSGWTITPKFFEFGWHELAP